MIVPIPVIRSLVVVALFALAGCGGSTTHTPTEMHDQQGEHLNYPAGGPNSPDYKKSQGKAKAEPKSDTEASADDDAVAKKPE